MKCIKITNTINNDLDLDKTSKYVSLIGLAIQCYYRDAIFSLLDIFLNYIPCLDRLNFLLPLSPETFHKHEAEA
jgi:hypothetical protein